MTSETIDIDEIKQVFADLVSAHRQLDWDRVNLVEATIDSMKDAGVKERDAATFVAGAAGCRMHWALLQYRIAKTFSEEVRYPTLDMYHYRIALAAYDPVAMITLAADEQLSTKQLKSLVDRELRGEEDRVTAIKIGGLLNWTGGDIVITPEEYQRVDLGEGLEDVPVRATITGSTHRRKRQTKEKRITP